MSFGVARCIAMTIVFGLLNACAPDHSSQRLEPLHLEPGEKGTFVAFAADMPASPLTIQASPDGTSFFNYALLRSDTRGISIGAAIDGPQPLSKNEQMSFIPASLTKLIAAAVALQKFGPEFRYKTEASWIPEQDGTIARDLVIESDGDPQTDRKNEAEAGGSRKRIEQLASELKARGIKKVVGTLRTASADVRVDMPDMGPGVPKEDHWRCYAVSALSFNFRRNCASIVIAGPDKVWWSDSSLHFPIRTEIATLPADEASQDLATHIYFSPLLASDGRHLAYRIQGRWLDGTTKYVYLTLPIRQTREWYAHALLAELSRIGVQTQGVRVDPESGSSFRGRSKSDDGQTEKFERLVIWSDPLKDLIRYMNKNSDNFFAGALFKLIAVHLSRETNVFTGGRRALQHSIEEWLLKSGHPEYADELLFVDGSGLSRESMATPRAILTVLKEISNEEFFPHLWNSLPIAGQDGTLEERMRHSPAQGVVRAKTGTLRGAYQLAGYVPKYAAGSKGEIASSPVEREIEEYVPFVILSSAESPASRTRIRNFQDQLVGEIVLIVNPTPKPK